MTGKTRTHDCSNMALYQDKFMQHIHFVVISKLCSNILKMLLAIWSATLVAYQVLNVGFAQVVNVVAYNLIGPPSSLFHYWFRSLSQNETPVNGTPKSSVINLAQFFQVNTRQMSISPTFYNLLFDTKVFLRLFLLTDWLCNFFAKEYLCKSCS